MRRDDSYLLDMIAAARQAARFAENMTYAAFERSDLHQNAIFKTLEVVGEAASRVSEAPGNRIPGFLGGKLSGCATGSFTPISISISRSSGESCKKTCRR